MNIDELKRLRENVRARIKEWYDKGYNAGELVDEFIHYEEEMIKLGWVNQSKKTKAIYLQKEFWLREENIKKYGDMFGLTKDLAQPISAYSHGMKQKLALISALIHNPKLLVMDEPFVGLDPKASYLLKEEMKNICQNGGAIFFSTHVLEVAEKICDKIAIIKDGKLIVSGSMDEVKGDSSLEDLFLELEGNEDFNIGDNNA